jgi:hypothetical protein
VVLILLGCLGVVVLLTIAGAVAVYHAMDSIVLETISQDLYRYEGAVWDAQLPQDNTDELLETIERLRARAADDQVGFWTWVEHTPPINEALDDGELDPDEAKLMLRQLERILAE